MLFTVKVDLLRRVPRYAYCYDRTYCELFNTTATAGAISVFSRPRRNPQL